MQTNIWIGNHAFKGYDLFNMMGYIFFVIFCLLQYGRKKNVTGLLSVRLRERVRPNKKMPHFLKSPAFYTVAESVVFYLIMQGCTAAGNALWTKMLHSDASNYFGQMLFGGLLAAVVLSLLRMDPLRNFDIFAPGFALELVFYKIGCYCAGCCRGIRWSHGVLNEKTMSLEFPVQLLESGVAFLIFIALLVYRRYNRHPGTGYPMFILLYSSTRFITEFWRGDGKPLLGILVPYQIQCLVGILVGAAVMAVAIKYGEQISARFECCPNVTGKKKMKKKKKM